MLVCAWHNDVVFDFFGRAFFLYNVVSVYCVVYLCWNSDPTACYGAVKGLVLVDLLVGL